MRDPLLQDLTKVFIAEVLTQIYIHFIIYTILMRNIQGCVLSLSYITCNVLCGLTTGVLSNFGEGVFVPLL